MKRAPSKDDGKTGMCELGRLNSISHSVLSCVCVFLCVVCVVCVFLIRAGTGMWERK